MKQKIINAVGALGYSSLALQWFWSIATIGLSFFMSDYVQQLIIPEAPQNHPQQSQSLGFELPGAVEIIIIALSVGLAIAIVIYALVAVPRTIGYGGQSIVKKSTSFALPHISHHKKLSKKQQTRLSERITWSIKSLLVVVPAILLAVPPAPAIDMPRLVVVVAGLFFAGVSLLLFAVQFALARLWKIPYKKVW